MNSADRALVDSVAALLLEIQTWKDGQPDPVSGSVVLRKLLTDGGTGHLQRAWRLLEFDGQPVVTASDLRRSLRLSNLSPDQVRWAEAAVARPSVDDLEFVTNIGDYIPADEAVGATVSMSEGSHEMPRLSVQVRTSSDVLYTWCVAPQHGSAAFTRVETRRSFPAETRAMKARLGVQNLVLTEKDQRQFVLTQFCNSAAAINGSDRLTRRDVITFVSNRYGAHIDPYEKLSFSGSEDAREKAMLREQRYTALRTIPSWVDRRQTVFNQLLSTGGYLAASEDVARLLSRWRELPAGSIYTHP